MGWLSGWAKRKSHILNAIAGSGTNYPVKIKVCYDDSFLDMIELKERVTWSLWDAYDGVCHDGTYHYCQIGNRIRKFDDEGNLVAYSPETPPSQDPPVCGDSGGITYYNNMIYLAIGDYTPAGNGKVALYNAGDLSYNSIIDISGDVPAGYCPADISYYGGYFWVVIHKGQGISGVAKVLKYDTSFVLQSSHDLAYPCAQGIDWKDNCCYINSQQVEGYTVYKHYLVKYDSSFNELDNIYAGAPLNFEWGGIGFDPNTGYLWTTGSSHQNQGWIFYEPAIRNQVSLEGNCQSDFGDVRFTDDDGETELSYWLDPTEGADGEWRYFWVKINDDLTSNQSMYVYYGKTDTTTSNGLNTFIRFSDFENHNIGDLPSAAEGWVVVDETSPNSCRVAVDPDDGSNKVLKRHQYNTGVEMCVTNDFPDKYWGVAIHYRFRTTSIGNYAIYHANKEDGTDMISEKSDGNSQVYYSGGIWNEYSPVLVLAINTWYKIEEKMSAGLFEKLRDGAGIFFGALRNNPSIGVNNFIMAGIKSIQHDHYIDNFFVRKFTPNDVGVHGTWGAEEETPPPPTAGVSTPSNIIQVMQAIGLI